MTFAIRILPLAGILASGALFAQEAPKLTRAEQETFLREAKIEKIRSAAKGVTDSQRATLFDGKIRHDAHIQNVDIAKAEFRTDKGTELNFKDSYKFNIAAYRLAKLMDLNLMPVYVERKVAGKTSSVGWWVDDVIGDEADRKKKKLQPPDVDAFNDQMYSVRALVQLTANVDANQGNLLTDKNWNLWIIDFTRSFRLMRTLPNPKDLVKIDRKFLAALRELNEPRLAEALRPYVTSDEIKGLLTRRDLIVARFDAEVAAKGEKAVLCDLPPR
jgi:hypothetical protein